MKPAESWSLIAFEVAAVRQSGERPAAAAAGYRIGRRPCRSFGGFWSPDPPCGRSGVATITRTRHSPPSSEGGLVAVAAQARRLRQRVREMPAMASATTAPPRPSTAVPVLLSALPGLLTLVLSPVVGVVGLLPSPLSPSPSPGLVGAFCRASIAVLRSAAAVSTSP